MTDSGENGYKQKPRDPKKIATIMLILIAVIMLALLVKNCASGGRKDTSSNSERAELIRNTGYADQSDYLIDYTTK